LNAAGNSFLKHGPDRSTIDGVLELDDFLRMTLRVSTKPE
jgi:hypothetical protein